MVGYAIAISSIHYLRVPDYQFELLASITTGNEARGFHPTSVQVDLIDTCTSLDTLKAWLTAAVSAAIVDDIFR